MSRSKKMWCDGVKKRANFECKICGYRGIDLHAHHLYSKSLFPEYAIEYWNGVALCKDCHRAFHSEYGTQCTEEDFAKFFTDYRKSRIKRVENLLKTCGKLLSYQHEEFTPVENPKVINRLLTSYQHLKLMFINMLA